MSLGMPNLSAASWAEADVCHTWMNFSGGTLYSVLPGRPAGTRGAGFFFDMDCLRSVPEGQKLDFREASSDLPMGHVRVADPGTNRRIAAYPGSTTLVHL